MLRRERMAVKADLGAQSMSLIRENKERGRYAQQCLILIDRPRRRISPKRYFLLIPFKLAI